MARPAAAVPVTLSSGALLANCEPAVPRPTTPPPRARNAFSAARFAVFRLVGFNPAPTSSTSTSFVSVVVSVVVVTARPSKPRAASVSRTSEPPL